MRFNKRKTFGGNEYVCDIFADSKNDVLIVDKIEGYYGLSQYKEDVCRDFILDSLKEVNQSPYYGVNLYNKNEVENEIKESIEYLQEKINKLELSREVNNIINKAYED